MFTTKALVLRLAVENAHRARIQGHSELSRDVGFIAKFAGSNSTLQCTLRDSRQAHHIVLGRELSVRIVGLKEDISALLVDVDEGPGFPVPVFAAARVKKRHFFETT